MQKLLIKVALAAALVTVSSMALAQPANDPAATTVPVETAHHRPSEELTDRLQGHRVLLRNLAEAG